MTHRRGFTLIELMVVVAVVAVLFTVASMSLVNALDARTPEDSWRQRGHESRARAIGTGAPVVLMPDSTHPSGPVLFLPDGRSVEQDRDLEEGPPRE